MRQRVVKALKPLDAFSVENPCRPGTPDVNYLDGWIELKWAKRWPVRADTPLDLSHYTPQQRLFQMRRWHKGGKVHLLVQVADDWLLFPGPIAAKIEGPRAVLLAQACAHWTGPQMEAEIVAYLSRPRDDS